MELNLLFFGSFEQPLFGLVVFGACLHRLVALSRAARVAVVAIARRGSALRRPRVVSRNKAANEGAKPRQTYTS